MRVQGELAPGTMVGTLTSDLVHLIEGAQRVVVVPPRTEVKLAHSLKDSVCILLKPCRGVELLKSLFARPQCTSGVLSSLCGWPQVMALLWQSCMLM